MLPILKRVVEAESLDLLIDFLSLCHILLLICLLLGLI